MTGGSRTICVVCGPGSSRHDNEAAEVLAHGHLSGRLEPFGGAQRSARPTCSGVQANQRSGMTGVFGCQGKTPTAGREAIRLVAGLTNSGRQVRRLFEVQPAERRKIRRSWSIMLTPCTGRSLAVLFPLPSAIGNASRRIAGLGRTKSRGLRAVESPAPLRARSARTANF